MKQHIKYSNEILNAYVDGELSIEDELELLNDMQKDPEILKRANELKRMKLLVHSTYVHGNSEKLVSGKNKKMRYSIAASTILLIGSIAGWSFHDVVLVDSNSTIHITNKTKDTWNIVLHVNTNDKYIQKTILDETESLLESFKDSRKKVKVEIVAYGKGIFLFDSEKSEYKERLMSLKNNFDNLSYAVCGRTIKRLEKKQGRKIHLISRITVARSGIYQIIKRQKQGWNYIRI